MSSAFSVRTPLTSLLAATCAASCPPRWGYRSTPSTPFEMKILLTMNIWAGRASIGFMAGTIPAATRGTALTAAVRKSEKARFRTRSRTNRSGNVVRGISRVD